MSSPGVSKLISRREFRTVLKSVVRCLRGELNVPGLAPLTAEEILFWFRNITLEDIEMVSKEIEAERPSRAESRSKMQSMMRKLRQRMRGSEGASGPEKTSFEKEPWDGSIDKHDD